MADHYDGTSEPLSRVEKKALRSDAATYNALAARLAEAQQETRNVILASEAELDEYRARLAEAERLLREGCGYIDDVPDARSGYKDRVRAFLRPADSASAVQTTCQHDMQLPDPTVTVTRWGTAECYVCAMVWHLPTSTVKGGEAT